MLARASCLLPARLLANPRGNSTVSSRGVGYDVAQRGLKAFEAERREGFEDAETASAIDHDQDSAALKPQTVPGRRGRMHSIGHRYEVATGGAIDAGLRL